MILIITNKDDYTADFVISLLNKKNIQYLRYNTEEIIKRNDINVKLDSNSISTEISEIKKFKSVWFRRIKYPEFERIENNFYKAYAIEELEFFLKNLWEVLDSKWLSIPHFTYRAESKLLQLKKAISLNFKIPKTIVTSNSVKIKNFYEENGQNIIIKPLYENRFFDGNNEWLLYTNLVTNERIKSLDRSLPLPSIYQENISKKLEIRVTVVNNKVFSASVDSQSNEKTRIDWRREKIKFVTHVLPKDIERKCVDLVKSLNLSFGAIDLILNQKNEYVFIEINPNGQWAWIEFDTGLKISEELINYLND